MSNAKRKSSSSRGAALLEYIAAVCLIAILCLVGITSVGKAIGEPCPAGDRIKTTSVLGKAIYFIEHAGEGGGREATLPKGDGCFGERE